MELFATTKLFWFVLGFIFLILEIMTPGIVFLFFGLGAWVVLLLSLFIPMPSSVQWAVFILVSVVTLATLRKQVTRLFSKGSAGRVDSLKEPMVADSYIGRVIDVIDDITPERPGMVELNGTNWRASSQFAIPKGARARIKEVRDLTLEVEPLL